MAEDNLDKDPEEENDAFDDDDFGLPDLEYDELDDDLGDDDTDTASEEESEEVDDVFAADDSEEESPAEEEEPAIDEPAMDEPVAEEPVEEEAAFETDDASDFDFGEGELNLDEPDFESIDADAEADTDDFEGILEPADESDLDDGGDFEAEFEIDEEPAGVESESDSVFGSDEEYEMDDYSDLDSEGGDDYFEDKEFVPPTMDSEKTGSFTKYIVIGVGIIITLGVGFIGYRSFFGGEEEKPVAANKKKPTKKKPAKKKPATKKTNNKPAAKTNNKATTTAATTTKKADPPKQDPPKQDPVPVATSQPAGTITNLTGQNGKAYIIVASFIDSDLANDHANDLASDGKSPYIIPPFKDYKYYRVGIAEFDSYSSAASSLDSYRSEYGADVWALRY